jgi:hypothetical protein
MISDSFSDKLAYIQGEQGSFRLEKSIRECFGFKVINIAQTALTGGRSL